MNQQVHQSDLSEQMERVALEMIEHSLSQYWMEKQSLPSDSMKAKETEEFDSQVKTNEN